MCIRDSSRAPHPVRPNPTHGGPIHMIEARGWTPITTVGNVPLREGRAVRIGDTEIAIFHLEDRYLTIENKCPHKGGPLCDGIISGTTVAVSYTHLRAHG